MIVYAPKRKTRGTVAAPAPRTTTITAELANLAAFDADGRPTPSTRDTAKVPGSDDAAKSSPRKTPKSRAKSRRGPSTPSTSRVPGQR